mgnify:CR=1 FL=1
MAEKDKVLWFLMLRDTIWRLNDCTFQSCPLMSLHERKPVVNYISASQPSFVLVLQRSLFAWGSQEYHNLQDLRILYVFHTSHYLASWIIYILLQLLVNLSTRPPGHGDLEIVRSILTWSKSEEVWKVWKFNVKNLVYKRLTLCL